MTRIIFDFKYLTQQLLHLRSTNFNTNMFDITNITYPIKILTLLYLKNVISNMSWYITLKLTSIYGVNTESREYCDVMRELSKVNQRGLLSAGRNLIGFCETCQFRVYFWDTLYFEVYPPLTFDGCLTVSVLKRSCSKRVLLTRERNGGVSLKIKVVCCPSFVREKCVKKWSASALRRIYTWKTIAPLKLV